ncbi:glycosyltransferase [Nocardioides sp. CFH 31398]|uniref:glycosyltransferase family 2 protein n=1 Tax=Nocardioides sp. CFH 31398 TaxID=2919579 RepID=UPI001F052F50|nr:glycosyltransferase [Nocardioides sp. CFH 31398]MCH1866137.1 glycosyltransferase [Nocardioides sp. CFH 31398]
MRLLPRALRPRRAPLVSVVVPAYDVETYLPACLDSILASTHRALEVLVVDDGSPDRSGEIADGYAARDDRVRVVRRPNGGLGAARNTGTAAATGTYLAFADSDDVVPPTAYATLVGALEASGSDFATGSCVRWEADGLHEPPWMRRLHSPPRRGATVAEHPELLGDVFAWNKLFRRSWWDAEGLSWPEGVRYEDQPTTTRAFLAGRFDVLDEVVYHWRIRAEGTSITQQRSSLDDLRDRATTKLDSLAAVRAHGDPGVEAVFLDRVLAGDLHRYFVEVPGCGDAWWDLLRRMVADVWGDRSLTGSGLPPVHRLVGWLVQAGRRDDAAAVITWFRGLDGPAPRTALRPGEPDPAGSGVRLDVPASVLEPGSVPPSALAVRPHEA